MRTGGCFQAPRCNTPQFGLGPGATLNLNSHFALDANFNILPSSIVSDGYFANGSVDGGRASEFLTGVRAEARARRYGFFLDAQPGFVSWSQVPTGEVFIRAPDGTVISSYYTHARRTFFASKVGAGFEYSPGTRMHVRVDFADLLIRYGQSALYICDTCVTWRNNPQITVGLYAALGQTHLMAATRIQSESGSPVLGRYKRGPHGGRAFGNHRRLHHDTAIHQPWLGRRRSACKTSSEIRMERTNRRLRA